MASPQRAAHAVTLEPSPSAAQIASSASPANFTTSPPCAPTSSTSSPKQSFSSSVSSSTPFAPVRASRSVRAVNPEMSANRTAAGNRSLSGTPNGSCRSAKRRATSAGT